MEKLTFTNPEKKRFSFSSLTKLLILRMIQKFHFQWLISIFKLIFRNSYRFFPQSTSQSPSLNLHESTQLKPYSYSFFSATTASVFLERFVTEVLNFCRHKERKMFRFDPFVRVQTSPNIQKVLLISRQFV